MYWKLIAIKKLSNKNVLENALKKSDPDTFFINMHMTNNIKSKVETSNFYLKVTSSNINWHSLYV